MNIFTKPKQWIDKKLGIEDAERQVAQIKDDTQHQVDNATRSIQEAGRLQQKVIKKTTTYYLLKAQGII